MDTLTTSQEDKLPESVRGLLVENQPLPAGVAFFEQRYTLALLLKRLLIAAALFLIALVLVIWSLDFLYEKNVDPKYRHVFDIKAFLAGAAFAYGGWLMASSVFLGLALGRRQQAGERTRHGIFLTPEALVSHSQFDTTVIPREQFRGLDGGKVNYLFKNAPNSFSLPAEWIGASPAEVGQSIVVWSQTAPPPVPGAPPVPTG